MKRLLSLFLCIMSFHFTISTAQTGQNKISGLIGDGQVNKLSEVNIGLMRQADSTVVKMVVSDENGRFVINNISYDTYLLVCRFIGYNNYLSVPFTIDSQHKSIVLPLIVLVSKDVHLGEVTISTRKLLVQHKIDRTTINVDAMNTAGSDILEVLGKSPGIMLDPDGDIKLNGKGNVLVLIDGKSTYLSVNDLSAYLKSLPAGLVSRLELINNPPARYDAASSSVINIILKKNIQKGFNGNVNLGYIQGKYPGGNDALNLNYRVGKFNMFSNLSYNLEHNFKVENSLRNLYTTDNSILSTIQKKGNYTYLANGYFLRTGIDFYSTQKTTVGILLTGNSRPKYDRQNITGRQYNDSTILENFSEGSSSGNYKWKSGGINLNFMHKIDSTGSILTSDLDFITYSSYGNQILTNRNYFPDSTLNNSSIIEYDLPSRINIYSVKTDYTHSFNDEMRFDMGFKSSYVITDNNTSSFDVAGSDFQQNYQNSNHFVYRENINAIYVNFAREWKRWAIQSGLRIENTNSDGHLLSNVMHQDSAFHKDYTHLFPTLYLSYKLDSRGNNIIALNYNTRIKRPNYQQLNPSLIMVDKYTFSQGNPGLNANFTNNLSLKYSYKQIFEVILGFYYADHDITSLTQSNGDILINKPGNFGTNYSYNIVPYLSLSPTKNWDLQVNGLIYYAINKGIAFGETINNEKMTGEIEINNQINLGHSWTVEFNGFYNSGGVGGQGVSESIWKLGGALQKKILKERGSLRIKVDDIFNSMITHQTIIGLSGQSAYIKRDSGIRKLGISFNYRFGNQGKSKGRVHKGGGAEDEKARVN
jgi:Outer membrane protein beta-barrel family